MTNPAPSSEAFPRHKSNCHGAPVEKLSQGKVKYFCTECHKPCIPIYHCPTCGFDHKNCLEHEHKICPNPFHTSHDVNLPASGTGIELTFRSPDGIRRYMQTPVDNDPQLLKYALAKFVDKWMYESTYLRDGNK